VTQATPISEMISRKKANTWYSLHNHTKFDDSIFSRSKNISGGVKF